MTSLPTPPRLRRRWRRPAVALAAAVLAAAVLPAAPQVGVSGSLVDPVPAAADHEGTPAFPHACDAQGLNASFTPLIASVTSTSSSITVTLPSPLPDNSPDIVQLNVCGPHGTGGAYIARGSDSSDSYSAGHVLTASKFSFETDAPAILADTDYWVNVDSHSGRNEFRGWVHIRTKPALPTECGANADTTVEWISAVSSNSSSVTATIARPETPTTGSYALQICGPHGTNDAYEVQSVATKSESTFWAANTTVQITKFGADTNSPALTSETDYFVRVSGPTNKTSSWKAISTLRTNQQPSFPATAIVTATIAENNAAGAQISRPNQYLATDPDGDTLEYSIDTASDMVFDIDPASAVLTATGALDRESTPLLADGTLSGFYDVVISVRDNLAADGTADTAVDDTHTLRVHVSNVVEPPGKVTGVSGAASTVYESNVLVVGWTEPTDAGGGITNHDIRYCKGDSATVCDPATASHWTTKTDVGAASPATITGLEVLTTYRVQVRATGDGTGEWSDPNNISTTGIFYNAGDDNLIDIDSAAKLNAIRFDLNGDGVADTGADDTETAANQAGYAAAFPNAAGRQCNNRATHGSRACGGYELTADIDLDVAPYNTGAGWVPIGSSDARYNANFIGNDRKISGLFINGATGPVGLFGSVDFSTQDLDLGLEDVDITSPGSQVGALAGHVSSASIRGVWATGTITATGASASNIGGLIGESSGGLVDAFSAVNVTATGASASNIGGLAGSLLSTTQNVYSIGSVTAGGANASNVGGLAGTFTPVGNQSMSNSFSIGSVTAGGASASNVGGLVGSKSATVTAANSYWDTGASGQSTSALGTAKTTNELQTPTAPGSMAADTYHGWSTDKWDFGTGSQYPALKGLGISIADQRAFFLPKITLTASPDTFAEDAASNPSVTITASVAQAQSTSITVTLTLGGTATRSSSGDYTTSSTLAVTIPANQTSGTATLVFDPVDDSVLEDTETIEVSGTATGFGVNPAFIRITDDDHPIQGLAAAATTPVSLTVSWTAAEGMVDDYDVRWFQGTADPATEADWVEEGETGAWPDPGTATSVSVTGLTANTSYRVQVRVSVGGTKSSWTESVGVTTQAALAGSEVLVSNVAHTGAEGNLSLSSSRSGFAQAFTTGANVEGYVLGTVEVKFGTAPSSVSVSVHSADAPSDDNRVVALAGPATPSTGVNTFTAPAGTVLSASTEYWLAVRATTGVLTSTDDGAEDSGSQAGWGIADTLRAFENSAWSGSGTGSLVIRVKGTTPDTTAPVFESATFDEVTDDLKITFSEALDADDPVWGFSFFLNWTAPDGSTGGHGALTSASSISGAVVSTKVLGGRVIKAGDTLTVNYSKPTAGFGLPVRDAAGNQAAPFTGKPVANITPPVVTGVAITSDPGTDKTYVAGDFIDVSVTFDANVTVDSTGGTPSLKIMFDPEFGEKAAAYNSGSGTKTLVFRYGPVESPNKSTVGVAVLTNTLALNSGTIKSATDADANLAHVGLAHDSGHLIDTKAPEVESAVSVGDDVVLVFDEALDTGSTPLASQFTYTVAGSVATVNSVTVAGSTVRLDTSATPGQSHTVTLAYTYDSTATSPSQKPIRDAVGNNVANISSQTVTKVTAPSFTDGASKTLTINENNADAASVGTVAATDGDSDTLTYSLAGTDAATFTIVSTTGEIKVKTGVTLNHETKASYSVTARVTDGETELGVTEETATIDDTIAVTINVGDVEEPPSGPPTSVTVTEPSSSTLKVSWTAPAANSGPAINDYDVRYFKGSSDPDSTATPAQMWTEALSRGSATSTVITGLDSNSAYRVQVRASNGEGKSDWTASADGMTNAQPSITLSLDQATLNEGSTHTFTVTATRVVAESSAVLDVPLAVQSTSTATSGTHYTAFSPPTISFTQNAATATATMAVTSPSENVADGPRTIVLGATVSGHGVVPVTITLNDDDAPATSVTLETSPAAVGEGATGAQEVTVTATLDGAALTQDVVVTFNAMDGTATRAGDTSSGDYTMTDAADAQITKPAAITIAANSASGETTVKIDPRQDTLDEGVGETVIFDATLSGALTGTGASKVTPATLWITDDDTASSTINLSFTPTSVNENAGSAVTVTAVTATLSGTATRTVDTEVDLASALSGTATAGASNDYTLGGSLPGSVTISEGSSSGSVTTTFTITPVDDSVSDGDKTIELTGSACKVALVAGNCPTGEAFTVNKAVLNLLDDDAPPLTLSSTTTTIAESANATSVTVKATIGDAAPAGGVSLALTLSGGATKGTDYTATPGTLTIAAGQTTGSKSFTITPIQDRHMEGTETIIIGGSHDDFGVRTHRINLTDDDNTASTGVTLSLDPSAALREAGGATEIEVKAELNGATLTSPVTVTFKAMTGTATRGGSTSSGDYTMTNAADAQITKPAMLTIAAGTVEATTNIKIDPRQDHVDEGTGETIIFTAALTGGLTGDATQTTLRIDDDDNASSTVNLSVNPDSVDEDHSGEATVTVTATLSGTKTRNVNTVVPVRIVAASSLSAMPSLNATSGDYQLKKFDNTAPSAVTLPISLGSITIDAESSTGTATFKIDPRDDDEYEGTGTAANEVIRIAGGTLANFTINATNLAIGENDNPTITITVEDTDTGTMGVQTGLSEAARTKTMSVKVALDDGARNSDTPVTISLGGTATRGTCGTAGNDYAASPSAVTISAGQTSRTFDLSVTVCEDRLIEGGETIIVNGTATGFDVTGATVTITDNDNASTQITLALDRTELNEDAGGTTVKATATVNDGAPTSDVTITLTLGGTATKSTATVTGDYSDPGTITVTIPANKVSGETSFTITPVNDNIDESDATVDQNGNPLRPHETITFSGGTSSGGLSLAVTPASLTIKIVDNDTASTEITLTANPASIDEDEGSAVSVTFTATLQGDATRNSPTTVTLDTGSLGGSATKGTDYTVPTTLPTSVTIAAGSSSGDATAFNITPTNDAVSEGDETITLGGSLTGFTVNPASITLADDDAPQITLSTRRSAQGNTMHTNIDEGENAQFVFTATRNTADNSDEVRVPLALLTSSTSTRGRDHVVALNPGTITIPANAASADLTLIIGTNEDRLIETGGETIVIGASVTGFTVNPATITINDDDNPSTAITLVMGPTSVSESGNAVEVTIVAEVNDGAPSSAVAIALTFAGTATKGTATALGDYADPGSVGILIDKETTSGTSKFTINPVNDIVDEGTGETIVISSGTSSGGLTLNTTPASLTFTITDDDNASSVIDLSVSPASIDEDTETSGTQTQADATAVTITATLRGVAAHGTPKVIALDSSLGGTASSADYTSSGLPSSVTIDADELSGSVTGWMITPTLDTVAEGDETITLSGSLTEFTVNDATVTLADNDQPEITLTAERVSPQPSPGDDDSARRSVAEGQSGTFRITATRDVSVNSSAVSLPLAITGGTATIGDHYASPRLPTIRIPANRASATASVTIATIADRQSDGGRTIELGGTAAGFDVAPVGISIVDDDAASTEVALSLGRASVREGGGTASVPVIATLNGAAAAGDATVTLTFGGSGAGSATLEIDYTDPGTIAVTIPSGQVSGTGTFNISPVDDNLDEDDETITVGGTASGLTVVAAELDIVDDDTASRVVDLALSASAPLVEGGSAAMVTVTATLSGDATRTDDTVVTLDEELGGTARGDGTDYTLSGSLPGSVTIAAGSSSGTATFSITPAQDTDAEGPETITLGGTATGLRVNGASISMADDDVPTVTLSVSGTAAEGESGEITVTATRAVGDDASSAVNVPLAVVGGTATAGVDYAALRLSTISIPAGESSAERTVTVNAAGRYDDRLLETGGETVILGGRAARLTVVPVTFTIGDNDTASDQVTLSLDRTTVAENRGPALVTATATVNNAAPTSATTVTLSFGGSAVPGTDYTSPGAITVTIPANEVSGTKRFSLNMLDDRIDEGDETISISGAASGGVEDLSVPAVQITVDDDDAGSASDVIDLSMSPARIDERDGDTAVVVTATLSGTIPRGTDTVVTLASSLVGSADGGTDYNTLGGTLPGSVRIPAGQLSGTATGLQITPINDGPPPPGDPHEGDETITLGGSLAGFTVNPASIYLADDDAPTIMLSVSSSVTEGSSASVTVTATRQLTPSLFGSLLDLLSGVGIFAQSGGANPEVSVPLAVRPGGSAKAGVDYTVPSSLPTVTIPAGQTTGTVTLNISAKGSSDDRVQDPDENIVIGVALSDTGDSGTPGFTVQPASITVEDDDAASQKITLRVTRTAANLVTVTAEVDGAAPDEPVTVTLSLTGTGEGAVVEYPVPITIRAGEVSGSTGFVVDPSIPGASGTITVTGAATGGLTVPVTEARTSVSTTTTSPPGGGPSAGGPSAGGPSGGGAPKPDEDAEEPEVPEVPEDERPPASSTAATTLVYEALGTVLTQAAPDDSEADRAATTSAVVYIVKAIGRHCVAQVGTVNLVCLYVTLITNTDVVPATETAVRAKITSIIVDLWKEIGRRR